jgi:hypothetical protein
MPKPEPAVKRFDVRQNAPNVHTIVMQVVPGWEQWFLLSGDRHHDNLHCDQDFEREHLEEAKEKGAGILDVGDMFCAMQGKYDPRSSLESLRPEHKKDNYFDALIETAHTFYKPYAANFLVVAQGNHETSIIKRNGTNLVDRFCAKMRESGSPVQMGGYGGWIRFQFMFNGSRIVKRLKYFHGSGGGGPVTRGVIQTNRQAVYLPDADIVLNGHTHDQYIVPIQRERLNQKGVIEQDCTWYVRTGTYKDEYRDGSGGWHVERGGPPKPIGAVWLKFSYENMSRVGGGKFGIRTQLILANRNG